jgi:hypothetical protein
MNFNESDASVILWITPKSSIFIPLCSNVFPDPIFIITFPDTVSWSYKHGRDIVSPVVFNIFARFLFGISSIIMSTVGFEKRPENYFD